MNLGTVTFKEGAISNGNGGIDPGESGVLVAQLTDPSLLAATNVSATLTTSTTGVTITQGTVAYGNLAAGGSADNSATPFIFGVSNTVACASTINFTLTVTFSGGAVSSQVFLLALTVGPQPGLAIAGTLGNAAQSGTGYVAASGQQTGRVARTGTISTCAAPKANPGLTVATGARQYDAYTFPNTTAASQCVTVTLTCANGVNVYCVAYANAGFVPANPSTNYLADFGESVVTQTFSFTAPAAQAFTVVVHDINVLPASNSAYTLSVSLSECAAAPACTPVALGPSLPQGTVQSLYSQPLPASGEQRRPYLFSPRPVDCRRDCRWWEASCPAHPISSGHVPDLSSARRTPLDVRAQCRTTP